MKLIVLLLSVLLSLQLWADDSVEIHVKYVKDNTNFIYMKSKKEVFKIKKTELTKEGVKQILANKDKNLTIFIPKKSITSRDPVSPEEE